MKETELEVASLHKGLSLRRRVTLDVSSSLAEFANHSSSVQLLPGLEHVDGKPLLHSGPVLGATFKSEAIREIGIPNYHGRDKINQLSTIGDAFSSSKLQSFVPFARVLVTYFHFLSYI